MQARGKVGSGWSADHPEFQNRGSDHPEFLTCFDFVYQVGPNISRRQTRTYRKSTKEETSGSGYVKERERETHNCIKKTVRRLVGPNNVSCERRSLQKLHRNTNRM